MGCEDEKKIAVFLERGRWPNSSNRETIGEFPFRSGEFETGDGKKVELDVSEVKPRMRGTNFVGLVIEGIGAFSIPVGRRSGLGIQALKPRVLQEHDVRIGVEIMNPDGILRKPRG